MGPQPAVVAQPLEGVANLSTTVSNAHKALSYNKHVPSIGYSAKLYL